MREGSEVVKVGRDVSPAFRLMGNSRRSAGRVGPRETGESLFEEAFKYYEEGNKCRPDDYGLLRDWAFAYLAQAARREGADARQSLASAQEKADAAMGPAPGQPHAHVARVEGLLRLARLEVAPRARDLLDAAREAFETALRIAPDVEGGLVGSAPVPTRLS